MFIVHQFGGFSDGDPFAFTLMAFFEFFFQSFDRHGIDINVHWQRGFLR